MGTYLDLKTRIADELIRSDGSLDTQIALEIQSAIDHYKRQRFWFNEGASTASTVAGSSGLSIAVPEDWIEFDEMTITDGNGIVDDLVKLTWRDFIRDGYLDTTVTSQPEYWAYFRDQFYLGPCPDAVYTLTLYYVKAFPDLSADGDENPWTNEAEALIRARARAAVEIRYLRDDQAIADQRVYAGQGLPFLNAFEQQAYDTLMAATNRRRRAGRLRTEIGAGGRFNVYRGY